MFTCVIVAAASATNGKGVFFCSPRIILYHPVDQFFLTTHERGVKTWSRSCDQAVNGLLIQCCVGRQKGRARTYFWTHSVEPMPLDPPSNLYFRWKKNFCQTATDGAKSYVGKQWKRSSGKRSLDRVNNCNGGSSHERRVMLASNGSAVLEQEVWIG